MFSPMQKAHGHRNHAQLPKVPRQLLRKHMVQVTWSEEQYDTNDIEVLTLVKKLLFLQCKVQMCVN